MAVRDIEFNHSNGVPSLDATKVAGTMKYEWQNEAAIKVAIFIHSSMIYSKVLYLCHIESHKFKCIEHISSDLDCWMLNEILVTWNEFE